MLDAATKVAGFFLQPSSLALAAVAAGLWMIQRRRSRWGLRLGVGGAVYLAVAGLSPLGNVLILPLEQQFPRPDPATLNVAGVIILGGAEIGRISAARGELSVNEAAERITEAARVARRFPAAKVVFTGGVGRLLGGDDPGAEPVARFLEDMGVARERMVVEDKSRNTVENATFTRALLSPKPGERWLLVTSAYHTPRAVGVFRKAGFEVVAYPVDFRTKDWEDATRFFDGIPHGLERVDLAVREWIGLLVYWTRGRTSALFPEP